jgi:alpha-tubulin suppressor-like RCC1 family protein
MTLLATAGLSFTAGGYSQGAELFVEILPPYTGSFTPAQISACRSGVLNSEAAWLIIGTDGYLYFYGRNIGVLGGAPSIYSTTVPARVAANNLSVQYDNDWAMVSCGGNHAAAIKQDGSLWTWGVNAHGERGINNTTAYYYPSPITSSYPWTSVACGNHYTLAISEGKLWATGENTRGQLGLSNTTEVHEFTQVGTDTNWAKVFARGDSTFAIKTDGTLWGWGHGGLHLGHSDTTDQLTPRQIGTDTDWVKVDGGAVDYGFYGDEALPSMLGLKSDGTLWGWGYNSYGGVGVGTNDDVLSPTQIGSHTDWINISANGQHCYAIRDTVSDGKILYFSGDTRWDYMSAVPGGADNTCISGFDGNTPGYLSNINTFTSVFSILPDGLIDSTPGAVLASATGLPARNVFFDVDHLVPLTGGVSIDFDLSVPAVTTKEFFAPHSGYCSGYTLGIAPANSPSGDPITNGVSVGGQLAAGGTWPTNIYEVSTWQSVTSSYTPYYRETSIYDHLGSSTTYSSVSPSVYVKVISSSETEVYSGTDLTTPIQVIDRDIWGISGDASTMYSASYNGSTDPATWDVYLYKYSSIDNSYLLDGTFNIPDYRGLQLSYNGEVLAIDFPSNTWVTDQKVRVDLIQTISGGTIGTYTLIDSTIDYAEAPIAAKDLSWIVCFWKDIYGDCWGKVGTLLPTGDFSYSSPIPMGGTFPLYQGRSTLDSKFLVMWDEVNTSGTGPIVYWYKMPSFTLVASYTFPSGEYPYSTEAFMLPGNKFLFYPRGGPNDGINQIMSLTCNDPPPPPPTTGCTIKDVRIYKQPEFYFKDICNRPMQDLIDNYKCILERLKAIDFPTSPATADTLGLVKVGDGLSITGGVLSKDADPDPAIATTTSLGVVKVGDGLLINGFGELTLDNSAIPIAGMGGNSNLGVVKSTNTTGTTGVLLDPSTSTLSLDASMVPSYSLPATTASTLGGTKPSTGLVVNSDGVLSLDFATLAQALDPSNTTKVITPAMAKHVIGVMSGTIPPGTLLHTTQFYGGGTFVISDVHTKKVNITIAGAGGNSGSGVAWVELTEENVYAGPGGAGGLCVRTLLASVGDTFTLQVGLVGMGTPSGAGGTSTCYSLSLGVNMIASGGGLGEDVIEGISTVNGSTGIPGEGFGGDFVLSGGGAAGGVVHGSGAHGYGHTGYIIIKEYA